MPNILILLPFCVLGALIGNLTLKKDPISNGLGVTLGVAIAFSIANHNPVYLLTILILAPMLYWRRRNVQRQHSTT